MRESLYGAGPGQETGREHEPQAVFDILRSPEGRRFLLERTDSLIDIVKKDRIDVVVFLDKSARPLSWLFRERLKQKYPEETSPAVAFVNFGAGQHDAEGTFTTKFPDNEVLSRRVARGRALSRDIEQERQTFQSDDDALAELREIYGDTFNGKRVLFVDDISVTGDSMVLAMLMFEKAFPEIKETEAMSFVHQGAVYGENRDLMPWFKDPGLIGVFDLLDEQAFLANTLDQKNLAQAEKDIKETFSSQLEQLQARIDSPRTETSATDASRLNTLAKALKEFKEDRQEKSLGRPRGAVIVAYGSLSPEEQFFKAASEFTSEDQELNRLAHAIAGSGKKRKALEHIKRNFGKSKQLRKELKTLAAL